MNNSALFCSNPFEPSQGKYIPILEGETISAFLLRSGLIAELRARPILVELNGREVLEEDFDQVIGDDLLILRPLVQDPISLSIIAIIVTVDYIVNSFIDDVPDPVVRASNESPSLSSRNNRARIGQAKPFLVGKMRAYPDLAARAFTEFTQDGTVELYQLFELTLGEADVDIASARFDETLLSDFIGAEIEVLAPGEISNIYPREVYVGTEIRNLELLDGTTAEYIIVPSGEQATRLTFDMSYRLYRARSSGKIEAWTAEFEPEIIEIDDTASGIDIHGAFDFHLAETALEYFERNGE